MDFEERLKHTTEFLEAIARNREVLANVSPEDQNRLVEAAGKVFQPDNVERRRLVKANRRRDKAAKNARIENSLSDTGIRKLRREKIFNTPNVFAPKDFEQRDVDDDPDFR